eukprot:jgi/Mesvir1/1878/Mv22911-RA.1
MIGKTNLDQFATGLVGVRSPYGPCKNPHDERYICGGSSSGSALSVALNYVVFSLGTDTAGSGRVPAAFTGIVGIKPTCGRLSTSGVVPACRSLDCVSIFANSVEDAAFVLEVATGYDKDDPFSRHVIPRDPFPRREGALRVGIPRADQLEFFGNAQYSSLFQDAVQRMASLGATCVEIDYSVFRETAALLYQGPWVAERLAALETFFQDQREHMWPITRRILAGAVDLKAVAAFRAYYKLKANRRIAEQILDEVDVMMTPTAGTIYTVEQVATSDDKDGGLNTNLGYYTNYMNLMDLCGIAVPAGKTKDDKPLPFGITLVAPAFHDKNVCSVASCFVAGKPLPRRAAGV